MYLKSIEFFIQFDRGKLSRTPKEPFILICDLMTNPYPLNPLCYYIFLKYPA